MKRIEISFEYLTNSLFLPASPNNRRFDNGLWSIDLLFHRLNAKKGLLLIPFGDYIEAR